MEQIHIGNIYLNTCIDFIHQQEVIHKYNYDKNQPRGTSIRRYLYVQNDKRNVCIVDMKMT